MKSTEVLVDAYGHIQRLLHSAVEGLTPEQLAHRVDSDANSIGWLAWHLTRIQDDHVGVVAGLERVWTSQGFRDRFALPFEETATGYGHSSDDVAQLAGREGALLLEYYDAVHRQTVEFLSGLNDSGLDRVVDERWDPPVTLGVRLVSVLSDNLQHAGQVAYLKGVIERT